MKLIERSDWDPTKWIIWLLHEFTPLVPILHRTPESAITSAKARVHMARATRLYDTIPLDEREKPLADLPVWSRAEVKKRHGEIVVLPSEDEENPVTSVSWRRLLLIIEGCVVDAGKFVYDHVSFCISARGCHNGADLKSQPGGKGLILSHAVYPLPTSYFDPSNLSTPCSSTSESGESFTDSGYSSGGHDTDNEKIVLRDATKAFFGGMNNHTGGARHTMRCLRVARLAEEEAA